MKTSIFLAVCLSAGLVIPAFGQTQWEEIETGYSDAGPIYFLDADTGWVAVEGHVLKTTDGGDTWSAFETESEWPSIYGLQFPNSRVGFLLTGTRNSDPNQQGALLRSDDGGETWRKLIDIGDRALRFFFLDEDLGWVTTGQGDAVLRTRDGGTTFVKVGLERPGLTTGIWFSTPDTGWVVGTQPIIMKTYDGGDTWGLQAPLGDPVDVIWNITGLGKTIWIGGERVGGNSRFLYSLDGGETWNFNYVDGNPMVYVKSVFLVSEQLGYRLILEEPQTPEFPADLRFERSTDGGATWSREHLPTDFENARLFVTDRHIWVAAGRDGLLRSERSEGVGTDGDTVPSPLELDQNYPNPFRPGHTPYTSIRFVFEKPVDVDLAVFDLLGRRVATLASGLMDGGEHTLRWIPYSDISSGVYVYRLRAGSRVLSRRLLVGR